MKAYIFIGGELGQNAIPKSIAEDALVICADSGYDNAKRYGLIDAVSFMVGDFDSTRERSFPSHIKLIRVPSEKDESDTELAVRLAVEQGAEEIEFLGGLSGRLDHTLANLCLIKNLYKKGVRASICDGNNRVRYIERSSLLVFKSEYKYFSLIPADTTVTGVTVDGAKYPLKHAKISADSPSLCISNEVEGNVAMVSCVRGGLFVIESKNAEF